MTVTTTRVDEDTCYRQIPCDCCNSCDDNDCCCDILYPLASCYWAAQAHYLKLELTNLEVENLCTPIASSSFIATANMRPQNVCSPDTDCCFYWQSDDGTNLPNQGNANLLFIGGSCASLPKGTTVRFVLFCIKTSTSLAQSDPALDYVENCNPGAFGWRLRVIYDNSACDVVPDGSYGPNNANYDTSLGTPGLYFPYITPICTPDNSNPCIPNQGEFQLLFRVEAPHIGPLGGTNQCDCCDPGEFYIIRISLDQDAIATPKNPNPSCCTPPTPPSPPSPPSPPPPPPPPPGP